MHGFGRIARANRGERRVWVTQRAILKKLLSGFGRKTGPKPTAPTFAREKKKNEKEFDGVECVNRARGRDSRTINPIGEQKQKILGGNKSEEFSPNSQISEQGSTDRLGKKGEKDISKKKKQDGKEKRKDIQVINHLSRERKRVRRLR